MVNFVNTASRLSEDVLALIRELGYAPNIQKFYKDNGKTKYTIRLCKRVHNFIEEIKL
jgi:ribosomal protein S8